MIMMANQANVCHTIESSVKHQSLAGRYRSWEASLKFPLLLTVALLPHHTASPSSMPHAAECSCCTLIVSQVTRCVTQDVSQVTILELITPLFQSYTMHIVLTALPCTPSSEAARRAFTLSLYRHQIRATMTPAAARLHISKTSMAVLSVFFIGGARFAGAGASDEANVGAGAGCATEAGAAEFTAAGDGGFGTAICSSNLPPAGLCDGLRAGAGEAPF